MKLISNIQSIELSIAEMKAIIQCLSKEKRHLQNNLYINGILSETEKIQIDLLNKLIDKISDEE